jgi:hypothetical protein
MSRAEKTPLGGDMVPVMRSDDPVRVRQVVALLADNRIECATPGLEHRSMLNFFGPYVHITVLVGEADAKRARGILTALESGIPLNDEPVPPLDPKATYRGAGRRWEADGEADDDEPPHGQIRLRRIAAFAALVFPSGAHLYTRRYLGALGVFALYLVALFAAPTDTPFRVLAVLSVTAIDIAGASYWADVSQGRAPRSSRRYTIPIGLVAVPLMLYALAHPLAALFAGPHGRAYCEERSACGADRDGCMREEARLLGTEAAMTSRCAECTAHARCDLEACARECDL